MTGICKYGNVISGIFGAPVTYNKFISNPQTKSINKQDPDSRHVTNDIGHTRMPLVTKDIQVRYLYGVGYIALVTDPLNVHNTLNETRLFNTPASSAIFCFFTSSQWRLGFAIAPSLLQG